MDNGKLEAIIFDLGNVLIDFDHMIAARRISHFCNKSPEEIFSLFFASDITTIFEKGGIAPVDFFLKVKEMLGLNLSYENFVPIWNEIFFFSQKNRDVFSLASSLRPGYKIAVLTNINILHFEYLKKYFSIFGIFDYVFTSFQLGLVKPDEAIYRKALEVLKIEPKNAFYTDDRIELVRSAKSLGIRSLVFSGIGQLKQGLLDSGINIT